MKTRSWKMLAALAGGAWLVSRLLRKRYDFKGKTVVITGGSRGLGLELARRFAREGARLALCARDAAPLGHDIIHSVTNPIPRLTGAIHVYGGDFFDPTHRSEWNPETLQEGPFDPERAVRRFEEANAIFAKRQGQHEQ